MGDTVRIPDEDVSHSSLSLSVLSGTGLTLWSDTGCGETRPEAELRLSPDRPAVIGRAEGWEVPYLDPAYKATRVVPGTGQCVLKGDRPEDNCVSRGHFMLQAHAAGIVLVNGVPRRGGGVRPPLNGTRLVAPEHRKLAPGEELLIERGTSAIIILPNGTEIRIESR